MAVCQCLMPVPVWVCVCCVSAWIVHYLLTAILGKAFTASINEKKVYCRTTVSMSECMVCVCVCGCVSLASSYHHRNTICISQFHGILTYTHTHTETEYIPNISLSIGRRAGVYCVQNCMRPPTRQETLPTDHPITNQNAHIRPYSAHALPHTPRMYVHTHTQHTYCTRFIFLRWQFSKVNIWLQHTAQCTHKLIHI